MNRARMFEILRKEFQIPRDVLKTSLFLMVISNLITLTVMLNYSQKVKMLEIEAELNADAAGHEMAQRDFASGQPRFLRINLVDLTAGATSRFVETTAIESGLVVWDWRCVKYHEAASTLFAESFVAEYNRTIESLRNPR